MNEHRKRIHVLVLAAKATVILVTATTLAACTTTAASQACHPSYAGRCVPIASDVDCASGNGDGPEYVSGPVRVIGPDVYGLDRDGDGVACER